MKVEKYNGRFPRKPALLLTLAILVGAAIFLLNLFPGTHGAPARSENIIAPQSFELCSANCTYPAPYLTGLIFVNNTSPMHTLTLTVNGVTTQTLHFNNTLTNYFYWFKGTLVHTGITSGLTYNVQFTATFNDNSTFTSSQELKAQ